MTREELITLGDMYCQTRPGSYLTDVDEANDTITTYFCGALLTSDALKVKRMLGLDELKKDERIA